LSGDSGRAGQCFEQLAIADEAYLPPISDSFADQPEIDD
jgi:hypothetical protein